MVRDIDVQSSHSLLDPILMNPKTQQKNKSLDKAVRDAIKASSQYVSSAKRGNQPIARRPSEPKAVKAPAASSKLMVSNKPQITADADSKRVRHRELLGSIPGSALYAVYQTVALNPGLYSSFPWLSTEALGWETYRFNSLKFEYVTRTGSNVPGSVILTTDYDASDAAPPTEQIAANYNGACEDAPWKDIIHECKPSALHGIGPRKFLRYGSLSANEDIKTYDSGNFFLCTVDGTAVPWGKLWVSYDVSFYTPQLSSSAMLLAAYQIEGTLPTSADPFSVLTGAVVKSAGPINVAIAGTTITFQVPGQYIIDYNATASTSVTFTSLLGTAGAVANYLNAAGSTTAGCSVHSIWEISAPGAVVTLLVTIVGGTAAHTIVSALPASPTF